jgi:ketosteroid isomerase-like protein
MLLKSYHWIHQVGTAISQGQPAGPPPDECKKGPNPMSNQPRPDQVVADLARQSAIANAALLQGDAETYRDLVNLADDFTLMSPFGGPPSHGTYSDARWREIGRFFRNGTLRQEVVRTYGSAEMVVLVLIEHAQGEVGGLAAQDWALRVTLVYRRCGAEWQLVHRHADPLANGISLEAAAALARAPD